MGASRSWGFNTGKKGKKGEEEKRERTQNEFKK
jgi:hypothetical protein